MGIARFTPLARNDLKAIRDFIALDKAKAASQYMSILKQHCQGLADFPLMGLQRPEYHGLYKFPVDDYLIFYRPFQAGIEVIRVLHSNRDIESLLNPDQNEK
ncbi:MAG: type II toxin-antitoxin system RelE/ParE family toxin [Methylococcales bacterium]|nr:type II toxin-antitoxin system RelE/ParE family toxin [Methylococcales bacterium]